jgi:hypothetical protein
VAEAPNFSDLFARAERSAWHLEMRDAYKLTDPAYLDWQAGQEIDVAARWPKWFELVAATVARGVEVKRVRVVSEPVSDYIKFEHCVTAGLNIAAGEQVRWLPRRHATDLLLPGNDHWLIDETVLLVNHFDGNGDSTGHELIEDGPEVAKTCAAAFRAAWDRATPHAQYNPA